MAVRTDAYAQILIGSPNIRGSLWTQRHGMNICNWHWPRSDCLLGMLSTWGSTDAESFGQAHALLLQKLEKREYLTGLHCFTRELVSHNLARNRLVDLVWAILHPRSGPGMISPDSGIS
jgi:hypothetical protein